LSGVILVDATAKPLDLKIMDNTTFMRRAIELSRSSINRPGTRPYGAVIVKDGKIVGEGLNQSDLNFDPTSHGEIEAIRDACRRLRTIDLSGCELFTSCEPCGLCVAAMYRAGIGKLYYAASLKQSNAAFESATASPPNSISAATDNEQLGRQLIKRPEERDMQAEQMMADEAHSALRDWYNR
jgi:tRNA(Arg) A34 adenosine deaminase TadA